MTHAHALLSPQLYGDGQNEVAAFPSPSSLPSALEHRGSEHVAQSEDERRSDAFGWPQCLSHPLHSHIPYDGAIDPNDSSPCIL